MTHIDQLFSPLDCVTISRHEGAKLACTATAAAFQRIATELDQIKAHLQSVDDSLADEISDLVEDFNGMSADTLTNITAVADRVQ